MDKNHALLNCIYQGAQMGRDAIDQLAGVAKDDTFLGHLHLQQHEYSNIMCEAEDLLQKSGQEAEALGLMKEVPARMSISLQTMMDASAGKMAEMMIQGSTMGIIQATKQINQHPDAAQEVVSLAKKLLKTEESNIEHLKAFL